MSSDRPYALVLGGGGTKGAYQIGAWRAFRELGISFEAVVGASVGALNAGLIAQDSYDRALEIWNDIALDDIVSLPSYLVERSDKSGDRDRMPSFAELSGYLLKHHGLDAKPLHDLLETYIDEAGVRASGIDLGITTYELTNFRQVELFLPEIPQGMLHDYLLASASFPAFRAAEIEGRRFTDGGIVDNIPYRMLKNRGYRRLIVVDVSGLGLNRRPDIVGTETVYLKNSIEMGSILDFDPDFLSNFMELGYLDTLRVFGRLRGTLYFIANGANDKRIEAELEGILLHPGFIGANREFLSSEAEADLDPASGAAVHAAPEGNNPAVHHADASVLHERALRATLPRELHAYRHLVIPFLECAALSLDVERIHRYTLEELVEEIRGKARQIEHEDLDTAGELNQRSIFELIKRKWSQINNRESGGGAVPYLYDLAFERIREKRRRSIYLSGLRRFYPALTPARIILNAMKRIKSSARLR